MKLDAYEWVAVICAIVTVCLIVADFLNHLPGGV